MGDEAQDDRLDTVLATLRDCLTLMIPNENVPPARRDPALRALIAAILKELADGTSRAKLLRAQKLLRSASADFHEQHCRRHANPLPPDFVYANQLGKQMKNEDMINIVQYEAALTGSDHCAFSRDSSFQDEAVHLPMIVKIMRDALSEPYHVFTYRYFVNDFKDLCYLAIDKRKRECVGAVVAKSEEGPNSMFPGYGYIGMLAVDPSMRRTGLGSLLVRKVLDVMREKYKYPGVLLDTEASNEAALNLYAKLGFMKFDFMQRYYMNGGDAHRLLLTFPKPEEALATPPPCSSTSSPDDIPCPPTTSCPDEEGEEIPLTLENVKCEAAEYLLRKRLDPHRPPDYPKPQKLPEVERPPQSPEPVARIPVIVEQKPLSKKQKRKKKASEMSQESGLGSQGEGGTSQEEVKTEESAEE